jgi:hypothetical protein
MNLTARWVTHISTVLLAIILKCIVRCAQNIQCAAEFSYDRIVMEHTHDEYYIMCRNVHYIGLVDSIHFHIPLLQGH